MTGAVLQRTTPQFERLDWESQHFGLPAAQLLSPNIDDNSLVAALRLARHSGVRFLVWPAAGGRDIGREILAAFGGALVDRKATFSRELQSAPVTNCTPGEFHVMFYASSVASSALIELAISAGEYSRFRIDSHFSNHQFEAMYRRWIERSVAKELADEVFVVRVADRKNNFDAPLGGMITLSESGGIGSIGLVAVAPSVRGKGIGSVLMKAAHGWMLKRGARQAKVVTQLDNQPACRLYHRAGYLMSRLQHYYHFWL